MIITRTPFRISLFGGGTDYPEWFEKNTGQVITLAINKYCHVVVRYLPPFFDYNYRIRTYAEQKEKKLNKIANPVVREVLKYFDCMKDKIDLVHYGDLPGLSGLGGSSAFTVGALNALSILKKKKLNKKELAMKAIYVERDLIKEKVGCQDQIICSYGGFRSIKFGMNGFKTSLIDLSEQMTHQLENNFIIVYTGLQRFSKEITNTLTDQIKKNQNSYSLKEISKTTAEAEKIIRSKNSSLKLLADLMNFQWERKKTLANGITNKKIDEIYKLGMSSGALGAKLLGAGGGGFLLFIVPDLNLKKFNKVFHKNINFKIKIDHEGSSAMYGS